ncbi:MAG: response regulator transcription factor [Proteobacteria bacterium]|nr:response regulator transcription factor [Pseudomonadota bacterium]
MQAKILVIEDDASIRLGLEDTLRASGYQVTVAARGSDGLELAMRTTPDLIILDIMLPDSDGFEICRRLKAQKKSEVSDIPVIMLSARGAEIDRVRGLEIGADDYVTKPFSLMELLARVAAVLRRTDRQKRRETPRELRFGDVIIDFARQEARKAGKAIALPARSFAILEVFSRRPGEVISRHELLDQAWGYDRYPNTRTVDNHIVKLRRALEDEPDKPRHLLTVHGTGYRLVTGSKKPAPANSSADMTKS